MRFESYMRAITPIKEGGCPSLDMAIRLLFAKKVIEIY